MTFENLPLLDPEPSETISGACYRYLKARLKLSDSEAWDHAKAMCQDLLFEMGGRDSYLPKTPVWTRYRTEAQDEAIRRSVFRHGVSATGRAFNLSRTTVYRICQELPAYRTGRMEPKDAERYEIRRAKLLWMREFPEPDETEGLPLFAEVREAELALERASAGRQNVA